MLPKDQISKVFIKPTSLHLERVLPNRSRFEVLDYERLIGQTIIRMSEEFMCGEVVRKVSRAGEESLVYYFLPATKWDYLKEFLTRSVPALAFGWLKPNYQRYSVVKETKIEETYFNVYPAEKLEEIPKHVYLSPQAWLRSQPPTIEELEREADKQLGRLAGTPQESAAFMVKCLIEGYRNRVRQQSGYW